MRGIELRLERLRGNGFFMLAAADHGLSRGLVEGLESIRQVEDLFFRAAEQKMRGLVLNYGLARRLSVGSQSGLAREVGLIVQMYGRPAMSMFAGTRQPLCTVEDAVAIGADCVSVQLDMSTPPADAALNGIANVSSDCRRLGVPLLLMVSGIRTANPLQFLSIVRSLSELPVDLLKVDPGALLPAFEANAFSAMPVACLYAGGEPSTDHQQNVERAMHAGFSGVCIGRNFFADSARR